MTPDFEILKSSLASLCHSGFKACLLRADPNCLAPLDDVDVLVNLNSLQRAVAFLIKMGWELLDTGLYQPYRRMLIRYTGHRFLRIDLHGEVVESGLIYMDSQWVLNNSSDHKEWVFLPSKEAWFLNVVINTIISKPQLAAKHHDRMRALLKENIDQKSIVEQSKKFGFDQVVEEVLKSPCTTLGDPERVKSLRAKTVRALVLSQYGNLARSTAYRFMWKVGDYIGLRRGFSIAVIGPDGAGKTTFIETLRAQLDKLEIPNRYVYMGPWEYPLLPTTKFLKRLGANPLDQIYDPLQKFSIFIRFKKYLFAITKRYMFYWNTLLEIWARCLIKVFPRILYRRIVILDRYIYDLEIGYYNQLVKNAPRLRSLIVALVPKPRLTILLDNDAEVIWARKKEYPLDIIMQARNAYHALNKKYNWFTIRTDKPVNELIVSFLNDHWRNIVRWRRDGLRRDVQKQ